MTESFLNDMPDSADIAYPLYISTADAMTARLFNELMKLPRSYRWPFISCRNLLLGRLHFIYEVEVRELAHCFGLTKRVVIKLLAECLAKISDLSCRDTL